MSQNTNAKLIHTTFLQRENESRHHSYDYELRQYNALKSGNIAEVIEMNNSFEANLAGHLSNNPVRNARYLFVAGTTLATRFSIEAGLEAEIAYNLSDLYIQQMDACTTVSEIEKLNQEMMLDFTTRNASIKKESAYTKPILLCIDYIYYNLHQPITVNLLSHYVSMSPSYLSVLFKEETGKTISGYIREKRIEAAQNMLRFSDFTYLEIATNLAYSSHSHFIKTFKEYTGMTPKEYRNKFFRHMDHLLV